MYRTLILTLLIAAFLGGQGTAIWTNSKWTVQAPPAGKCGSLPLLQVKGPGSIFSAANVSALASLQDELPIALGRTCPGVREVILASGRERRLIKVGEASRSSSSETVHARGMLVSDPVQRTESNGRSRSNSQPQSSASQSGFTSVSSSAPTLPARSALPSLSSAHGNENKCEVLYKWLQSGKAEGSAAQNYSYWIPTEMLEIFRDEPMVAVFGVPYDRTENRWRLQQHDKVISRCLGLASRTPPSIIGFGGVRSNSRTMQQYWQQFAQYRLLFDQSFLGEPGPFQPSSISRYVQQVREQTALANQVLTFASTTQPNEASFKELTEKRQSAVRQLAALTSVERAQVVNYLSRRQAEIAPEITESWLRTASGTEKSISSARVLHNQQAALAPVLSVLGTQARVSWDERYQGLLETLIGEPLKANVAKISTVPSTLPGVLQLITLKSQFDAEFGDFRDVSAVEAARGEYERARIRILASALPTWRQEVDRLALEAPAVAAKHQEFERLFPSSADRSLPLFSSYEAPLKAKEDQVRVLIAAKTHKDQKWIEDSNPSGILSKPNSAGQARPVTATGFTARGLQTESTLTKLFTGDFLGIDFNRNDVRFNGLFDQYLVAYSRHCSRALPDDMVEMTKQECRWSTVTEVRNGWGTLISSSETCNEWRTVHVGWAKPALYDAKKAVDLQRAADVGRELSQIFGDMAKPNVLDNTMSKLNAAIAVAGDMDALVQINACKSPGLERFEENLRLFALNKQPIRLDGKGLGTAVTVIPGIPFKDGNYTKLLADLVEDDAQKWGAMAKYVDGSVAESSVASRDDVGRPAKIVASYAWNGVFGRTRGSVTLTFTDGLPDCFYYSETPSVCHAANRKIVAAYADGAYQQ